MDNGKAPLNQDIYNSMNLKDTQELLAIWIKNDTNEWRQEAFDVIEAILRERNVEVPAREVKQALEAEPAPEPSPADETVADRHFDLAYAYWEQSKFPEALAECDQVLALAPQWPEGHNLRGVVLEELGRNEEAIAEYRQTLKLDPRDKDAKENLASLLSETGIPATSPTPVSPGTDATPRPKERISYYQKTLSLQHSARKKVGSMLGRGIGLTVGGILIGFVGILGARWMAGQNNLIVGIAFLFALGAFFSGIFMVFKALFSKARTAVCPYCGHSHRLFSSFGSYVCDGCGHVLRFGGSDDLLSRVTCPRCGLEWAAAADMGATHCHSCGAAVTLSNGVAQFSPDTHACPDCQAGNPVGSYFCWRCGTLLGAYQAHQQAEMNLMTESMSVQASADGMDSISIRVNTPVGLIYRAVAKLNQVSEAANQLQGGANVDMGLVQQIDTSLEELEEALEECPEFTGSVGVLLPSVTHAVAGLLKDAKIGTLTYTDRDNFNSFWAELSGRFNLLMEKVDPTSGRSDWPQPLLRVKLGASVGSANPPRFQGLLENEAALKQWIELNLPPTGLTGLKIPTGCLKA